MATKKLANELGLIRKRSQSSVNNNEKQIRNGQLFSYLIVIDFESTCWRDKNNYGQEIIEFPAVVLNTMNGKIESEFHTYVQPQEHPVLSKFCTELTGIQQEQVEAGVPLHVCLSLFTRWIQTLQKEKNIVFFQKKVSSYTGHPCAFVTWSDWDFGVCLQYECKRKQISKPDILNHWIDLRATYKLFYNRKPKGLNGALQDLGITFSGREHSGLDDARNTAQLAWRMISDGCLMKVTGSLERVPVGTKPLLQMNPNTGNVGRYSVTEVGIKKYLATQPKPRHFERKVEPSEQENYLEVSSTHEICQHQTLVLPKILSHGLSTPGFKGKPTVPTPLSYFASKEPPLSATAVSLPKSSLVLVATTIGCNTNVHEADTNSNTDPATLPCEWTETPLFIEPEDSRSYDDVILEDNDASATSSMDTSHHSNSVLCNTDASLLNANGSHSKQIVFKNSNTTLYSLKKHGPSSYSTGVFKTPLLSSGKLKEKSLPFSNAPYSAKPNVTCGPEKSEKYSGFNMSTSTKSFSVYKDDDSCISIESSGRLRSIPSLPPSSSVNRTPLPSRSAVKMTSPLCNCGRRAKRLVVGNGGPNHGRVFFSCPIGKMVSGNKKSCAFFKWESTLLKARSGAVASRLCAPRTSFASPGKSIINNSFSPHTHFARRPSLRN